MNYPDMCYVYIEVGCEIGIVKFGESGYYQTDFGSSAAHKDYVNKLNEKLGVSEKEAFAMKTLSMNKSINGNVTEWKRLFEDIIRR